MNIFDQIFKDKHGQVVIAQSPNLPLFLWIVLEFTAVVLHGGRVRSGVQRLSSASLLIWAYLEITRGVNYFRRLLGLVVAIAVIISFFMN